MCHECATEAFEGLFLRHNFEVILSMKMGAV